MKIVTCPIPRWAGTAQIYDPLTLHQVAMVQRAIANVQKMEEPVKAEVEEVMLPAILACVVRFNMTGIPEEMGVDQWPGSPRDDSAKLFEWLLGEIMVVYRGEVEPVPLA